MATFVKKACARLCSQYRVRNNFFKENINYAISISYNFRSNIFL